MVHALLREPEWRCGPLKGSDWDNRKAQGMVSPFSPIYSQPGAMTARLERGGPLLGRYIPSRPQTARPHTANEPVQPSDPRPHSARPEWNSDVSLPVGYNVTRAEPVVQLSVRPMSSRGAPPPHPPVVDPQALMDRPRAVTAPAASVSPRRAPAPESLVGIKRVSKGMEDGTFARPAPAPPPHPMGARSPRTAAAAFAHST